MYARTTTSPTSATPTLSAPLSGQTALAPVQLLTLILGFLIVAADGYDVASVGYIAPLLIKQWALAPAQMGPIFGAGLLGLCLGSFVFGPLADRIGRKRVIVIALVLFGLGSLACAQAPSPGALAALRFITGLGLGGALPTMITLAAEMSPERNRSLLVTLMLIGFPLGLALGGLVAAQLIPQFGWQGVFVFGGVFPLCLAPLAVWYLPESLKFMAGKARFAKEAARLEQRLPVTAALPTTTVTDAATTPVRILFSSYYRGATLLLWLAFFCTLWVYYQLSSWLPTVITQAGINVTDAALVSMMLPLGGAAGAVLNAFLMDRLNPFVVLAGSYITAAVCIGLIGFSMHHPTWVYVATFMGGFGLIGAQTGINVLTSSFYTTAARATGVSWSLAVGRIGSIFGAMSGGVLLAAMPSVDVAFMVFAIPTVIAGCAIFAIGQRYRAQPG